MPRTGITYEQVATAADALVGQGEKPSIQRIRCLLYISPSPRD